MLGEGARTSHDHRIAVKTVRNILIFELVLNVAIAVAKIVYGAQTNALAIEADGYHSLADGLNNIIGLVGIWFASHPPDEEHPYGHRKFEIFAALFIGASLMYISIEVLGDAWSRFTGQTALPNLDNVAYIVLGATWVVNISVASWQAYMAKKLNSPLLMSDAKHTRSDVLVTAGVVLSVVITQLGFPQVDMVAALGISVFIAWTAYGVVKENFGYLADERRVDPEQVRAIALGVDGVEDAYDIRSRGAPAEVFIDLTLAVDPQMTVEHAHEVTHAAIDAIKAGVEGCVDVTAHTEPVDPSAG
jgi:cation diffusion facilitator family transporter